MSLPRYRCRAIVKETTGPRGSVTHTGLHTYDSYAVPWTSRASGILDLRGPKDEFHPVSHVHITSNVGQPAQYTKMNLFGPNETATFINQWLGPPGFYGVGAEQNLCSGFDLGSKEGFLDVERARGFTRRALDQILDQFPESVSIANFILELKDLRGMVTQIKTLWNVPGTILNWNFGWLPLIADIKSLLTVVADVRKRLEFLKKVNGRTVSLTYRETHKTPEDPEGQDFLSPLVDTTEAIVSKTFSSYEVEARLNAGVHYNLDLDGVDAFLNAMCSALGLMNPAKIIWNAIPFSFVFDWVTHFGDWLDQNTEVQPFQGTLDIVWCTCSFKTRTYFRHCWPVLDPIIGPREWAMFAETTHLGYHRRSGAPASSIELTGLTSTQQVLAAALVSVGAQSGYHRYRFRKKQR